MSQRKKENTADNESREASFALTKSLTLLMSVVCGVSVANLYYVQPLESQIAATFGVSQAAAGVATMLTQFGYALGLLLFVPLGDMSERRKIILRMLLIVAVSLLVVAAAPSYAILLIFMFLVGITTIVPQIIVPYAAHLAKPEERGGVIGVVMSGLLIGILLSRTFSGILGQALGWRVVYVFAAGFIVILMVLIRRFFPVSQPTSSISYGELLRSIPGLVRQERVLRESAANGFFMFGAFSAFWTSLVFLLETPVYHMGSREAGLFGLAGVAGALAAPIIGKTADRRSPRVSVGIGVLLSGIAFLCFLFFGFHIWGLILGVVILDLGNQSGQISNQARVQALGDETRSRNNTVFMFVYFIGGASGSLLGTIFWQLFGWYGVCGVGLTYLALAAVVHLFVYRKQEA